MNMIRCTIVLMLALAGFGWAEDGLPVAPAHTQEVEADAPAAHPHPVIPSAPTWAGVMVIVILVGFFLPAAVIGPMARALAPEDEPLTESHDGPPGASHHHDPEGTDEARAPH